MKKFIILISAIVLTLSTLIVVELVKERNVEADLCEFRIKDDIYKCEGRLGTCVRVDTGDAIMKCTGTAKKVNPDTDKDDDIKS